MHSGDGLLQEACWNFPLPHGLAVVGGRGECLKPCLRAAVKGGIQGQRSGALEQKEVSSNYIVQPKLIRWVSLGCQDPAWSASD